MRSAKTIRFANAILACLGAAWPGWSAAAAPTAAMPASLPLYFEANPGTADSPASFIARGPDCQFEISPGAAQFVLRKTTSDRAFSSRAVRMRFIGANGRAPVSGAEELPGKINYLLGADSAKWRTGVATFARVRVADLYPGVNLDYHGNQRRLEYDFTVAPDTDPGVIAMRFDGADKISISPAGELVLNLGGDEIRQPRPDIYQTIHGERKEIGGGYKLLDAQTVAFAIGDYDRGRPLVIDPLLSYSTYFGGNWNDLAAAVAVDTNGFVYVAGQTLSTQLATPGAVQTNFAGGIGNGDAFVAKFGSNGTNVVLVYCTYLGGSQDDLASSLAVDNAGRVYLTGYTDSADFPTTNALYPKILGSVFYDHQHNAYYSGNAFVAELNPNGSRLLYSTYLGGGGSIGTAANGDEGMGIAVDPAGNAYVAGYTSSTNFPATNSLIYQLCGTNNTFNHLAGAYNAFLAKIGPGGTNLIYSTYFGGTNIDVAAGIAVDGAGSAYLAGFTDSTNFPTTANAFQTNYGGLTNFAVALDNAFVAKFAPSGTNLIYSTYLGGSNYDQAFGIAVDAAGNAYVTGGTTSPNFPNTVTNLAGQGNGLANNAAYGYPVTTNAFLTQITWNGTNAAVGYSAVFGGTNLNIDFGYGVAVDPAGNVFVCGASSSTSFPVTTNNIPDVTGSLSATNSGGNDAFVIAFSPNAAALLYSAYLGGAADDFGYGVAVDPMSNVYIVGQTLSVNFPTNNAYQAALNGPSDAFLAKILFGPPALSASASGGTVQVGWNAGLPLAPELPRLFRLESSASLVSTNWTLVPQTPVLLNNRYTVTFNPTNPAQFFRLRAF